MWVPQPHQRNHKLSISSPANLKSTVQTRAKLSEKYGIIYLCHANYGVGVSLLELLIDSLQGVGASQGAGDEGALFMGDFQQMVKLLWSVSWLPQIVFHIQPLRNTTWKYYVAVGQDQDISYKPVKSTPASRLTPPSMLA